MATTDEPDRSDIKSEPLAPTPRISLNFEDGSADEDFAWIAARFRDLTGATDTILSLHSMSGEAPELLMTYGEIRADTAAISQVLADAARAVAPSRRRSDGTGALRWGQFIADGASPVALLALPLAADRHHQIVLTSLFRNGGAEGQAGAAALRLYPVLVGYFRLWLVARAQRRRLEGFASALHMLDTPIYLLDGHGGLLFANAAGEKVLDSGEGLRRVGPGLGASEMADSVKLRVAIDHLTAPGEGRARVDAALVRLHRGRGRRPLVAAVMPAETAPRTAEDPALVLLAFDPELDVAALLAPVCQIYGLSPAETRLACLLAEGFTVNDAALRMRVKVPTLRTYLKQIFGKTGTARQSDLIRLLMGSLVRTRPGLTYRII